MFDKLTVLQAEVTKTASFQGAALDIGAGGTPLGGMKAHVFYKAAANASGSNTVTFSVEHSANGTDWFALASGAIDAIALTTTAKTGEIVIPFITSQPYVRLALTVSGGGGSPAVTYEARLGLN